MLWVKIEKWQKYILGIEILINRMRKNAVQNTKNVCNSVGAKWVKKRFQCPT